MEIFDLPLFEMKNLISEILQSNIGNQQNKDLVFTSLSYGVLVNSKIYLIKRAFEICPKDFMIWVDAGINRFYENGVVPIINLSNFPKISNFYGVFEIDLINWARNFKILSAPRNWIQIGSSKRVISGGTFIINGHYVNNLESEFQSFLKNNLRLRLWDTEQVNLLKFAHNRNFYYHVKSIKTVTNILAKSKPNWNSTHLNLLINRVINLFI
jgi:hypothetical protein